MPAAGGAKGHGAQLKLRSLIVGIEEFADRENISRLMVDEVVAAALDASTLGKAKAARLKAKGGLRKHQRKGGSKPRRASDSAALDNKVVKLKDFLARLMSRGPKSKRAKQRSPPPGGKAGQPGQQPGRAARRKTAQAPAATAVVVRSKRAIVGVDGGPGGFVPAPRAAAPPRHRMRRRASISGAIGHVTKEVLAAQLAAQAASKANAPSGAGGNAAMVGGRNFKHPRGRRRGSMADINSHQKAAAAAAAAAAGATSGAGGGAENAHGTDGDGGFAKGQLHPIVEDRKVYCPKCDADVQVKALPNQLIDSLSTRIAFRSAGNKPQLVNFLEQLQAEVRTHCAGARRGSVCLMSGARF